VIAVEGETANLREQLAAIIAESQP